jgi:hypothetical protein
VPESHSPAAPFSFPFFHYFTLRIANQRSLKQASRIRRQPSMIADLEVAEENLFDLSDTSAVAA